MFKRVRWTTLGYVAGVGTSWAVANKVRKEARRLAPPEVARRSADRVRDAVHEGRSAMRDREASLRREFDPAPVRPVRPLRNS
jgi:hypothetical protein